MTHPSLTKPMKRHHDYMPSWIMPTVFDALESSALFQTCQNVFSEATGLDLILQPADGPLGHAPGKNGFSASRGPGERPAAAPIRCGNVTVAVLEAECPDGSDHVEDLLTALRTPLSRYACEVAAREVDSGGGSGRTECPEWVPHLLSGNPPAN